MNKADRTMNERRRQTRPMIPSYDRRKKPLPVYHTTDIEDTTYFGLKALMFTVWGFISIVALLEILY